MYRYLKNIINFKLKRHWYLSRRVVTVVCHRMTPNNDLKVFIDIGHSRLLLVALSPGLLVRLAWYRKH